MNVRYLIKFGKILSRIAVIFPPIIWIILKYGDLLLVDFLGHTLYTWVYIVAWYSVVFVMVIRPLADLFPKYKFLRQLCLLRRAFGILSAMFIVVLLIDKWIENPNSFVMFFTPGDWTLWYPLMARLSEITAIVLLLTSNNFAQKKLGKNWKRIQRSSYVYFLAGGVIALRYGDDYGILLTMIFFVVVFCLAALKKQIKKGTFDFFFIK